MGEDVGLSDQPQARGATPCARVWGPYQGLSYGACLFELAQTTFRGQRGGVYSINSEDYKPPYIGVN